MFSSTEECACKYAQVYACMYAHVYACQRNAYTHACIYRPSSSTHVTCSYAFTHVCTRVRVHLHTCVHARACTHTYHLHYTHTHCTNTHMPHAHALNSTTHILPALKDRVLNPAPETGTGVSSSERRVRGFRQRQPHAHRQEQ